MFQKSMTPLTKGGQRTAHKGKGSQMASMPNRSAISGMASAPGQSINDYSKATPMSQPSPQSVPGIGTGDWTGNGQ